MAGKGRPRGPAKEAAASHPLSKPSCPRSPNQARGTVAPPLSSCPPQPRGPSMMLIWMRGASLSGDPPRGTAQQFQKNRDLYSLKKIK